MTWHPDMPEEYKNQIVTGDARELAKRIPDESIGVILTSPPYNVGLNYDGFVDDLPHEEHVQFNREWLFDVFRIAKEGCRLYVIVSDKMLFWIRDIAEEIGWSFCQILVWCKPNLVARSRISNDWNYMTEPILLFIKGKRTPMLSARGTRTFNWFIETVPQSNFKEGRIHPAQLPISLCKKILSRTPGEPILDPFAGSGSVLVAAKELGRKYIGMELVGSVSELARERVLNTQPPLFVMEPEQLEMLDE